MHEFHLVNDLFADVMRHARQNGVKRIVSITVRLGALSEINEHVLRHAVEERAAGTCAEGARLIVEPGEPRELRLVSYDGEH